MSSTDPSIDRLAHNVLQPGFAGAEQAPAWLQDAVRRGLGGVVYFSHNIATETQTAALSQHLHALGELVIATDEEGGIVSRLGVRAGSPHVGAAPLGRVDDPTATRAVARAIGADLRASGIDMDLAPVADVNSNPANPVIGVRSFGATPQLVARHAEAYADGLRDAGVIATAKHFPGHGDTSVDSHVGLPTVDAPLEVLRERELAPFAALVAAGVPAVMTAHVVLPALDADRPATISPRALGILREELGFTGTIVTDALDMGAIADTIGLGEGCVQALLAGADLLGLGNPGPGTGPDRNDEQVFRQAHSAIVAAVQNGRLPAARLEEAADRIRLLRQVAPAAPEPAPHVGDPDAYVAARSLRTRGDLVLPGRPLQILDVRHRANVAAGAAASPTVSAILQAVPGSTATSAFELPTTIEGHSTDRRPRAARDLPVPDLIVAGSCGLDDAADRQLGAALRANPHAVVLLTGYEAAGHPVTAPNVVWTLGDSVPTARAVTDLLVP